MYTLYQFPLSGNCHKVRMLLGFLDLPYETVDIAGAEQQQRTAAFLAMNPFGQVPVLGTADTTLRDSQAILLFLAMLHGGDRWWPTAPVDAAAVAAWLSTSANEVARGPNLLRLHRRFGREIDITMAFSTSTALLRLMNDHLMERDWLVTASPTIADVAMYPYIALAPEAKLDLSPYPVVRAWIARVQRLPRYIGMPGMFQT